MRWISSLTAQYAGMRSNRLHGIIIVICCIIFPGACAPRSLYYWGNYEEYLYNNNLKSDPEKAFNILSEIITNAERTPAAKLGPGLYAEYGFMLYKQGKTDEAVIYFSKESEAFPESEPLMNKLIARIKEPETINSDARPVVESKPEFSPESIGTREGER